MLLKIAETLQNTMNIKLNIRIYIINIRDNVINDWGRVA